MGESAIQLVANLRSRGIRLVDRGDLRLAGPQYAITQQVKHDLAKRADDLLSWMRSPGHQRRDAFALLRAAGAHPSRAGKMSSVGVKSPSDVSAVRFALEILGHPEVPIYITGMTSEAPRFSRC